MANIKSAAKRIGVNNKKRALNQSQRSEMRSLIKHIDKLIDANDVEGAKAKMPETTKKIDKAVQKGVIHKNSGSRQKSRLMKKINEVSA